MSVEWIRPLSPCHIGFAFQKHLQSDDSLQRVHQHILLASKVSVSFNQQTAPMIERDKNSNAFIPEKVKANGRGLTSPPAEGLYVFTNFSAEVTF